MRITSSLRGACDSADFNFNDPFSGLCLVFDTTAEMRVRCKHDARGWLDSSLKGILRYSSL